MSAKKYIIIEEENFNDKIRAAGAGIMIAEDEQNRNKFIGQLTVLKDDLKKQHLKTKEEILQLLKEK